MKKILIIPLLLLTIGLSAAPIGEQRAREIATSFFQKVATRGATPTLELAWAGDNLTPVAGKLSTSTANIDESLLYIYNRIDSKGHIVIAGDDTLSPIIAFSYENPIDMNNLAPNLRFMLSSWSKQVADYRQGLRTSTRTAGDDVGNVVLKYETALWNQTRPFDQYTPVYDGQQCNTGCVATALAIICHYNKWPDYATGTTAAYTYVDSNNIERSVGALKLGHTYNYSLMRSDNYTSGYTSDEADAVATLMRDIGYASAMSYHYTGSGTDNASALYAMVNHFRYSKQTQYAAYGAYTKEQWVDMIIENIKNCGPTYFSGIDYGRNDVHVGHAFVLDGYTSGKYISINYGWGGSGNAFYILPEIDYMNDQIAFVGMVPDPNNTTKYASLLSYKALFYESNEVAYAGLSASQEVVQGQEVQIKYGALVNRGAATFNGRFRFAHCDKSGNVKWTSSEYILQGIGQNYYTYGIKVLKFTQPIAEDDKIVLQYKGDGESEWKNALREDEDCSQSILMLASPESIAELLSVKLQLVNENSGESVKALTLSHNDNMDFKSTSYTITNSAGKVVYSGTFDTLADLKLDIKHLGAGDYTVKVSIGKNTYQFTLTL